MQVQVATGTSVIRDNWICVWLATRASSYTCKPRREVGTASNLLSMTPMNNDTAMSAMRAVDLDRDTFPNP